MSCNKPIIARMTYEMLDGVCDVERRSFSLPWSRQSFAGELKNKCSVYFTASVNGKITGYAGMHIALDEADITNIAVAPAHRKKGIAQQLLDALVNECRAHGVRVLHLDVRESNCAALSLYEKNGFVRDGLRKNYYSDTREAAILMSKTIIGCEV